MFFQAQIFVYTHFLYYAHKAKCQQGLQSFLMFFSEELSTIILKKMAKNELIHEVIHFIHKISDLQVNFIQWKTKDIFCAFFTKRDIQTKDYPSNCSYKLHTRFRK